MNAGSSTAVEATVAREFIGERYKCTYHPMPPDVAIIGCLGFVRTPEMLYVRLLVPNLKTETTISQATFLANRQAWQKRQRDNRRRA